MRSIWKGVPAIGLLGVVFGSTANAADVARMPPPPPPLLQSAPPLLVDEFSSGWYLRGDIGYRFNNSAEDITNAGALSVGGDDFDKSWVLGAGVGYKLDWFRSDFTVDYGTRSTFTADSAVRSQDFTARIDSVTGLINIYGDLGTWFGLTPYVGVGAGFAHLRAADFNVVSAPGGASDAGDSWNFAWAYMAGVSYRVMGNYHLDLGYRHVNMGDVQTGNDRFGNRLSFQKVSSDEVRLGFRYTLD